MKIMYSNAQSVIKKMEELRAYVVIRKPDIVILTETWTNSNINDDFIKIKGYKMVVREDRQDTVGGRGGGVIVYARKELNVWRVEVDGDICQLVGIRCG